MKDRDKKTSGSEELRRRAEERLKSQTADYAKSSPEEARAMLQELHIHQIELEMQNEQLRQTQAELEAAVTRYADFYDFAPVAYLTLDERGQILEANLNAATMLGVERRRLLQRLVTNFIVREDRKIYLRHLQQLFETQGPQHYELRMVRRDGTQFWAGMATIAADNNNVRLCKATISDITERKRIEEELRVSEEKYRLVSENNYHWEYWISPSKTLIYNSPSCLRITGYASAEFIAAPKLMVDIIHPEDREIFTAHYREITDESLGVSELEFRITTKGGENRWLHHVCQPVFGDQSIWMGRRASNRDITDHKLAEEALRASEERYRSLIANTINAVALHEMLYDSEGRPANYRFLMVNPAFEKIAGFSSKQVVGKTIHQVFPVLDPFWIETYGRVVVTGAPVTFARYEEHLKRHLLVSAYKTGVNQFAAIFSDITEQKELESQFLQAQKMEAVGRLAGGVAHDFNNMLNVIIGYGDLMNQKLRPQTTQARYLGEIMKASDRATALTRQLLAFSRKTISVPQILNLNDHLAGIEKMLTRVIGEDIEIRMAFEPDLGVVHVDPGHVEQIVMNLVVNARDALPRGGKLTLETANVYLDEEFARLHTYVTPGHYVMLAVTDNGQGMDAATQARIFEPFFTTKEVGRGTGLGLSTVYGLVKQNNGHIEVYSEIGSGTTFKAYLPEVQEPVPAISAAKPVARDLHGSETILVVEDEDMLRESICRGLKIYGYSVLAARQGGEALLLAERHPGPIHLLLTDVVMPQMDGRDLANRLTPLRPDIKVLYMSGYTENAIVHHGVLETGIFFIPKPFRIKTLLGKIREILGASLRQP
jgi:PAS domain S-box-containing protein